MSYPINPPVGFYMRRSQLVGKITDLGGGLWKTVSHESAWFFWEPPDRKTREASDWLVGPYRSRRSAERALSEFTRNESDGPEVRTWFV